MFIQLIVQRLHLALQVLIKGSEALHKNSKHAASIPQITQEEIEEIKHFYPALKYFIFGHARSGTTLLTRLIRTHPQVHCNYQAHFFSRPPLLQSLVERDDIRSWLSRRSNRWNHGKDLSPLVLRAAADFIMERELLGTSKTMVGDKSPNSLLNGEAVVLMHQIYPDAKLIYIIRDGRDAVLSHRFQQFIDAEQHLNKQDLIIREDFSRNPEEYFRGEKSIFTEKGLRKAAQGWVKNLSETISQGKTLYKQNFYILKYEDLLQSPVDTICSVWSFLGADNAYPDLAERVQREMQQNPDADWQREKAKQIASPLEKGKKGSWHNLFTLKDKQIFKEEAGMQLIEWGYAQSLDW